MDVSQLELPSLEALLSRERAAWDLANKIGRTPKSWEEHESYVRQRHAELVAMPDEERDIALVEGHLANASMLESTLKHIDTVLMPLARAREAMDKGNRSRRRAAKKKKRGKR